MRSPRSDWADQFAASFDAVMANAGIEVVKTRAVFAANRFAERPHRALRL